MVKRRGIGATTASAVVFSIVLISNFAIYASSQNRGSLYSQADLEEYLATDSVAFAGASGANVLFALQSFLAGQTFDCSSAPSVVAAEIGVLSDNQSGRYLAEAASAREAPEYAVTDNLSSLAPFNGSLPTVLDVSLRVLESGGSAPAGVWLAKTETHLIHLPVRLDEAVADCLDAAVSLLGAVSSFQMANCTVPAVASFMGSESSQLEGKPTADGFEFSLRYAILDATSCSVGFQISIEQANIQGIDGPFRVLLEDNGSASFARPG